MLDIVPRESTPAELAPVSKAIADRNESPGVLELHAHRRRTQNRLRKLSDNAMSEQPPVHILGAVSTITAGMLGVFSLSGAGTMTGLLIGTGTVSVAYGAMIVSWLRTKAKDKRALATADVEVKELQGDLAQWLKSDYGLTLSSRGLRSIAGSLVGLYSPLDPTTVWTFRDSTGASFKARIVQREDGDLELHRASISKLGEKSLIQPLKGTDHA